MPVTSPTPNPNIVTAVAESTTARTLGLTDAGKVVECSNASGCTVTVPTNGTAAFALGTVIELFQSGAGAVTVAAAGGVTIDSPSSALKSFGQYSTLILRKTATNEWSLSGDLAIPTQYQLLVNRGGFISGGSAAAAYYLNWNATATSASSNGGSVLFPLDSTILSVGNLTLYCMLEAYWATNANTQTGITFTWGLYPVGTLAGNATSTITVGAGSLVTGSSPSALVAPAGGTSGTIKSSDFAFPAAGLYYMACTTSGGSTGANNAFLAAANLFWRAA